MRKNLLTSASAAAIAFDDGARQIQAARSVRSVLARGEDVRSSVTINSDKSLRAGDIVSGGGLSVETIAQVLWKL